MPRPRKQKNEETPVVEFDLTPNLEDPSNPMITKRDSDSNVLPFTGNDQPQSSQPIASNRDWSDIDSILSDVVTFI